MGWTAVVFTIQSWLNESPAQVAAGKQPAYFAVAMSLMSLLIVRRRPYYTRPTALPNSRSSLELRANRQTQTYMPIFFPPPNRAGVAPQAA